MCWAVGRIHTCVHVHCTCVYHIYSVRDGLTANNDRKCIGMCAGGLVAVCLCVYIYVHLQPSVAAHVDEYG